MAQIPTRVNQPKPKVEWSRATEDQRRELLTSTLKLPSECRRPQAHSGIFLTKMSMD